MKSRTLTCLVFLLIFSQNTLAGEGEIKKKLASKKVTLDLKDAPLEEVLRLLSKASGVPIVVDPKIYQTYPAAKLKVTMKITDLNVLKCLELVLDMTSLEMGITGKVVRVGDRKSAPRGAVPRAHYVADLMLVIRDFPAPRLGLMKAYPERPYTARSLYGDLPQLGYDRRQPDQGYFPVQRLDSPFSDRSYVPLGTPHFGSSNLSRPIYRNRNRKKSHTGGLSNPAVLKARLEAMTGGNKVWDRPGVGMRLTRGGNLIVLHTPAVQARVKAAISKLRRTK